VTGLLPLIRAYCPQGGTLLDAFAGSGTTGVAARQCQRRFILIEQDATYHRAACQRFHPFNVGIDTIKTTEGESKK
jgi:adenine-specific DNA-methyltransferase